METTREVSGARQQDQGIYNDDGGVGGGRSAQRLKQQQQRRRMRIYYVSKGLEMTMEAGADQLRAR